MILEEIIEITASLQRSQFQQAARAAGFQLAGVAPAAPVGDYLLYQQWLAAGHAGPMAYLADHRASLRADPRSLLPSARSVLCLGLLYNTPGPTAPVSRYAWGTGDYHDLLRHRLAALVRALEQVWGAFEYKICVDTAPLLERSLARQAGLGWIGRNTCLINQSSGSWFFLGEILTSVELEPDSPPPGRCGSCTRCIDACPTQALVPSPAGRWRLDARLCISTWTIEQHGALPAEHRAASGLHVFGCDICQEVCPWNSRAPYTAEPAFQPANPGHDLTELAALTPEAFRERFSKTPLWRTKYAGLMRNVATAMGNSGDPRHIEPLRRLAAHPDAAVSEHAHWALHRLETGA